MSEIKVVSLSSLKPNPYRPQDTPLDEERVALLVSEIKAAGDTIPWPIVARAEDRAIPYGHHRLEAARRALGKDARVAVVFNDIEGDEMVRQLAAENDEDYAHDFLTATLTSVRAYLLAYDAGVVDLTPKAAESGGRSLLTERSKKPYSAQSLADSRGGSWLKPNTKEASEKVKAAVAIISEELLTDAELKGLGPAQVRAALELARKAKKAREAEADASKAVLEEAAKRAERARNDKGQVTPDKKAAESARKRVAEIEEKQEEQAQKAARETARQAVARLRGGESIRNVKDELEPVSIKKAVEKVKKAVKQAKKVAVEPYTPEDYANLERALLNARQRIEDETPRAKAGRNKDGRARVREAAKRLRLQAAKLEEEML